MDNSEDLDINLTETLGELVRFIKHARSKATDSVQWARVYLDSVRLEFELVAYLDEVVEKSENDTAKFTPVPN